MLINYYCLEIDKTVHSNLNTLTFSNKSFTEKSTRIIKSDAMKLKTGKCVIGYRPELDQQTTEKISVDHLIYRPVMKC